jgi:hypothetical protein
MVYNTDYNSSTTTNVPYVTTTLNTSTSTGTTPDFVINWPSTTWTTSTLKLPSYYVFRLPESNMPYKVYAAGRLLTLGMFGSDAEVAFCGVKKLIFAGTVLQNIDYISIEYKDCIYHYKIFCNFGVYECEENSCTLKSQLLSIIR